MRKLCASITKSLLIFALFSFFALNLFSAPVAAEDYSSTNFILRDPVVTIGGERSTSANFEYFSSSGQIATGETTSANFIGRSGFLYFPVATSPIVSAVAGNGQVNLSWTASVGALANITSYEVGTAAVSGGPYSFQSVDATLSFTKTGLTNNTTYFFRVKSYADTLLLAQSGEVSAIPTAPAESAPPSGGGGGGGGGGYAPAETAVIFSGRAYPGSKVVLLKDGQIAVSVLADPLAAFNISLSGLSAGNYTFSLYGEDKTNERSPLITFPITVTSGTTTRIGGIFIAPTIAVDKSEVKKGDTIAIFGQSAPQSEITIGVSSEEESFVKAASDKDGAYLYNLDTSPLEKGQHAARSKSTVGGEISPFSKLVGFKVGSQNIAVAKKCPSKADLNKDCRVNLVDFSIAAYWYKRALSQTFAILESQYLNNDKKIDLVDFSIMAYYWTG